MKSLRKYRLLILWIVILIFIKFFFFNIGYDRFHMLVSVSTFLLYLSVTVFIVYVSGRRNKTIVTGVFVFLTLLILLEFISYMLLGFPAKEWKGYPVPDLPVSHKGNYLGSVAWADSIIHDKPTMEGEVFADVSYSIDKYNRRITPGFDSSKKAFGLFFGCSVCFGFGLNDDETIPYRVQNESGKVNAYNYAFNGWGPHHMLALFEHEKLNEEVHGKNGFAVYVLLWSHIRRAIGDYQVYTGWGHTMPYYKMENGKPVYMGNFADGRRFISTLYEWMYKLYTIKYFELNFPLHLSDDDYELVAEIILKSKNIYSDQFGNDNFVVVLYPEIWQNSNTDELLQILPKLESRGIKYLNYNNLSFLVKNSYILKDGHPNAKSNEEFSRILWDDLENKILKHALP